MGRHIVTDASIRTLEEIYRAHLRRVRWILRARGIGDDALDDLVHEVFLAIHRRLPERDEQVPLPTWISGVARNVAFSHHRSAARERRGLEALPAPHPPEAPDALMEKRRAWSELEAFLGEIDPPQREVFVLAELLGMRMPEVAEVVDAPLDTLYSRLRLARRRFHQRFGDRAEQRWLQRAGEGEAPSPAQRQHAWALLAGQLVPATATIVPIAGAGIAKWWLGAATAVALAGGAVAITRRAPEGTVLTGDAAPQERVVPRSPAELAVASTSRSAPEPEPPRAPAVAPTASPLPAPGPVETIPARAGHGNDPAASPEPESKKDESGPSLARAVEVLRTAQRRIAAGDAEDALGAIDEYRREFDRGPLFVDMLRLERDAACRAGRAERAEQALAGLRALGVAPSTTACPLAEKTPTP